MKKLFGFCLSLLALFSLSACGDQASSSSSSVNNKLQTPTNVAISEANIATWDSVENAAKYRLNIVSESAGETKRVVDTNQADLNTFSLAYGKYTLYVQAVADKTSTYKDSDYSETGIKFELVEEIETVQTLAGTEVLNDEYVKWLGRTSFDEEKGLNLIYHSGSSFEVKFKGQKVTAELFATNSLDKSKRPYIVIIVDNDYENRVRLGLEAQYTTLDIASFAANDGQVHTVAVYKSSESTDSHMGLKSLTTDGTFIKGVEYKERSIEFIAASSSTGYGNLTTSSVTKTSENSDCMQAFSYYTASALNADMSIYSASGWGVAFSNWTTPKSASAFEAYRYIDFSYYLKKNENMLWDISKFTPDVIVINFGTNDWSYIRTGADQAAKDALMEQFICTYVDYLAYLHNIYPNAHILMMYGLMGEKDIYAASVEIYNRAVVNNPGLGIIQVVGDAKGSNSHPSVASHKAVSEDLIAKIKEMTGWN